MNLNQCRAKICKNYKKLRIEEKEMYWIYEFIKKQKSEMHRLEIAENIGRKKW